MQGKQTSIKPSEIVDLILRRRWFIIIPFCLAMITGIYLSITLPRKYRAETMILVQPQKVPSNFVQSLVSVGLSERISTIKQQILSRSNLEKIVEDFKLFSEPENAKMYAEDKIENLHKRISVQVIRARAGADAFSISFEGTDPERVMKIANSLASYFINENLKVREAQAIGTSDFLDDQLSSMRKRLENSEEALGKYRTKFMGSLPEQLDSNLRVLDRLQVQFEAKQQVLKDAKVLLLTLDQQISEGQQATVDLSMLRRDSQDDENTSALQQLKDQLEELKTRYTDKHPDVVRLERTIAKLEGKTTDETLPETPGNETPSLAPDPLARQKAQRQEIQREIANLEAGLLKIIEQIDLYQQRVEDSPKREQELLTLKRNYGNMQEAYSSLLSRKLEAEMSVSMEKKQKGEQFRILDYAKIPEKTISPDIKKIFGLSLAAGLGIGGGLVFLLFYFDSSFRGPEEIETVLGISVLATLPKLYHPKDLKRQKIHLIISIFSIVLSFVLVSGFAVLTIKGVDKTLVFLKNIVKL